MAYAIAPQLAFARATEDKARKINNVVVELDGYQAREARFGTALWRRHVTPRHLELKMLQGLEAGPCAGVMRKPRLPPHASRATSVWDDVVR